MNRLRHIAGLLALATAPALAQNAHSGETLIIRPDGTCGPATPEEAAVFELRHSPERINSQPLVTLSQGRLGNPARTTGLDIQFSLTSAAAANADVVNTLEDAAQFLEATYEDEIVLNYFIDVVDSNQGFLAATSRIARNRSYSEVRAALVSDAGLAETDLVNALPTSNPTFDNGSSVFSSSQISVTISQGKAIGLGDLNGTSADSAITFNLRFFWDFDRSDGIASFAYDFFGTALHEFGHALGFVSAVDGGTPTVWDLFRSGSEGFANDVDTLAQFTATPRVLGVGDRAAFDTAGGIEGFTGGGFGVPAPPDSFDLSTGTSPGGDGRQASHWRDDALRGGLSIGIMDPTGSLGELDQFTEADTIAFSIMGYDLPGPMLNCNAADISEPFGTLDLSDVQTFLIGFGNMDPIADIVEDSNFDLQDVQTFLIDFGAGCP